MTFRRFFNTLTLMMVTAALFVLYANFNGMVPTRAERTIKIPALSAPRQAKLESSTQPTAVPKSLFESLAPFFQDAVVKPIARYNPLQKNHMVSQINAAMEEERFEDALKLLYEARELWPEDGKISEVICSIYNKYGVDLINAGQHRKALDYFKKVYAECENDLDMLTGIGFCYLNMKQRAEAEYVFKLILDKDDRIAMAHFGMGEVYYQQNKTDRAIAEWKKTLQLDPTRQDVRDKLAKAQAEYGVERHFYKTESTNFALSYDNGFDNGKVRKVLDILERAYRKVGRDLDHHPLDRIPVVAYSTKDFQRIAGVPNWVSGIYDGKIRLPAAELAKKRSELTSFLTHEYTHVVIHGICGNHCPTWLNEGIAQYEEGRRTSRRTAPLFYKIIDTNNLVPLSVLENGFLQIPEAESARLAYEISLAAVEYLVNRYTFPRLQRLLKAYADGKTGDEPLQRVLGIGRAELLQQTARYFAKR